VIKHESGTQDGSPLELSDKTSAVKAVSTLHSQPLLNDSEAANQLGVSSATLRSWRCRGIGPSFIKMGAGAKSPVRYTPYDIAQFIERCRQVPPVLVAREN
jgi:hypothetical protein